MDSQSNKRSPNKPRTIVCGCGVSFIGTHSQAKHCSEACRREKNRQSWREYGERNRSKRRRYYRQYYRQNADQVIERTAAYHQTERGKEASRKSDQRQKLLHPERLQARQMVKVALKSGVLIKQPCVDCGSPKVHAHHENYHQPLEVVWLCAPHHREWDQRRTV